MTVHAEIGIIPISGRGDTSMSKGQTIAFEAIPQIKNSDANLGALEPKSRAMTPALSSKQS